MHYDCSACSLRRLGMFLRIQGLVGASDDMVFQLWHAGGHADGFLLVQDLTIYHPLSSMLYITV